MSDWSVFPFAPNLVVKIFGAKKTNVFAGGASSRFTVSVFICLVLLIVVSKLGGNEFKSFV